MKRLALHCPSPLGPRLACWQRLIGERALRSTSAPLAACALVLVLCGAVVAASARAQTTTRPPILGASAPLEAVEMWQRSAADASVLFEYLDREALRKALAPKGYDGGKLPNLLLHLEFMAVERMGDIASASLLPRMEAYLVRLNGAREYDAATTARLAIERVRLRAQGRDAYVRAMIAWVQTPAPAPPPNADELPAERSFDQQTKDYCRQVIDGARALGVLQATEAVPVLIAKRQDPVWDNTHLGYYLVRALARLGDARALPILREQMLNFAGYVQSANVPRDPDEPDVASTYWQIRTRGMTQDHAIQDMLQSLSVDSNSLQADEALACMGNSAVPAMLTALSAPAQAGNTGWLHGGIAAALGRLRAPEAVGALLKLLADESDTESARQAASCHSTA